MPAETAAATGVAVERQETNNGTEAAGQRSEGGGQRTEKAHAEPIGGRLTSILGLMNLPNDVREAIEDKEEGKGKKEEVPEESASGQEEEGEEHEGPSTALGTTSSQEEVGELTEEEKTQWPPEALARIHKATAQRETARTETKAEVKKREALEEEVKSLRQRVTATPVLGPTPQNPLSHVQTPVQLEATEAELEHCMRWTRRNPDGGLYVGLGKKEEEGIEIGADEVPNLQDDLEHTLRKAVPAQREHLKARAQQEALARQDYPALFDESNEDYQLARVVIERMPELLRFPDAMLNVGIYVEGFKAYMARKKAAAEKASGKEKTPENPAVAAFTRPQPKRAPSLPNVQRPTTEKGGEVPDEDVTEATKRAVESEGKGQAMEDLVASLRTAQRGQRGGQRLTTA